jgi:hypothetical protein
MIDAMRPCPQASRRPFHFVWLKLYSSSGHAVRKKKLLNIHADEMWA